MFKRLVAVSILVLLVLSVAPLALSNAVYDQVVIRGSLSPLDWSSNYHRLTYEEAKGVWLSKPIRLTGGRSLEFKYVYDDQWMPGANLEFTPPRDGKYIFAFHPQTERRVDVRLADSYQGKVILQLQMPEDIPSWIVPTIGTNLNGFDYTLTELEPLGDRLWQVEIGGEPGRKVEYLYSLGGYRYLEVRDSTRQATFSQSGSVIIDAVTNWRGIPLAKQVVHDFNHEPFIPTSNQDIEIEVTVTHYGPIDQGGIYYTSDGRTPVGQRGVAKVGDFSPLAVADSRQSQGLTTTTFRGLIPGQPHMTPVKYLVDVWSQQSSGSQFADTNSHDPESASEFAFYVADYATPQWAKEAIIYHVFVDRFMDGNPLNNDPASAKMPYDQRLMNWMGGDLAGVSQKLDYLRDLGFNTIWLSPVFSGPYSHGYHPTDFTGINPYFGDRQELAELISQAHARDMRVIYDFVPNHTSSQHPFFADARLKGPDSPYYDWYTFYQWPSQYATFYDIAELPQFNNDHPEAREYMLTEVVPFWLAELDFDGFRLDYAKGPSYSFWVDFRHAVKSIDEDKYIFGEIWDDVDKIASYVGKLDGALDFQLRDALVDVFINNRPMYVISDHIKQTRKTYHPEFITTTFLDNHDLPRFIFLANEDPVTVKLAAATLYTLPGSPVTYYGTEAGLSQSRHHDEVQHWKDRYYREMMPWNEDSQNLELMEFYPKLNSLRENHPTFTWGEYQEIQADQSLLAFTRSDEESLYLVLVNNGEFDRDYSLQYLLDTNLHISGVSELLTGETISGDASGDVAITSSPRSVQVYQVIIGTH